MAKGLKSESCEEKLRQMRLFNLEKQRLKGDHLACYSSLKGGYGQNLLDVALFLVCSLAARFLLSALVAQSGDSSMKTKVWAFSTWY